MLVLSRRQEEVVVVGEAIRIKVVRISNGRVKLGFEAPPDVPIHRLEIWKRINGDDTEKVNAVTVQEGGK